MGTFAGLAYWNDWTNGLYYIVKNTGLYNVCLLYTSDAADEL